ncbi:PilX N-terminal domain-containing pilus assembly protein [Desulfopila sp. IMCC35006]|uniref:PilX N-terminal domain-containing pilus assembly protein n=1 Tax=Desulfopila sp. IMCC35006 TaxID=2569542 RepID=UPI00142F0420|nr:PilX N-terminal domain-containing pilus assembly protein [Desulfopila sp. IMCC35006]
MDRSVKTGEEGFILVFTLLLLVVVTLLGVSSINTSVFESSMSANDALYKRAFSEADGGANVAGVVIEENVSCPNGFGPMGLYSGAALIGGNILIGSGTHLELWKNPPAAAVKPTDTNRDAYFFYDPTDPTGINLPRTNITAGGETVIATGSALQMAAGYEGRGKGMAGGGAYINYDAFSQHIGNRQSESIVEIDWRHVVGFEGKCKY